MMKYMLFMIPILVFVSCSMDYSTDCMPESRKYEVFHQSIIDSKDSYINIESGNKHVFKYTFIHEECSNINDDEYYEEILFEIKTIGTHFSYSDEQLVDINCLFYQDGAWHNDIHMINSGSIIGALDDNIWIINAELMASREMDTLEISFSGEFLYE